VRQQGVTGRAGGGVGSEVEMRGAWCPTVKSRDSSWSIRLPSNSSSSSKNNKVQASYYFFFAKAQRFV
jgi:hypothetical protein